MAVECPYCGHRMRVKGAHPGKFLPACDRCGDSFILVVPAETDSPMLVTALDERKRKFHKNASKHPSGG